MPLTSRPMGRPVSQTPWPVGPTFQPLTGCLHGDTLHEIVIGNLKMRVDGGRILCSPNHVARPTDHNLVSYRLNQVSNPSLDPYKYPPPYQWKSTHHTLVVVLHL
jgi:hypothetical protein